MPTATRTSSYPMLRKLWRVLTSYALLMQANLLEGKFLDPPMNKPSGTVHSTHGMVRKASRYR